MVALDAFPLALMLQGTASQRGASAERSAGPASVSLPARRQPEPDAVLGRIVVGVLAPGRLELQRQRRGTALRELEPPADAVVAAAVRQPEPDLRRGREAGRRRPGGRNRASAPGAAFAARRRWRRAWPGCRAPGTRPCLRSRKPPPSGGASGARPGRSPGAGRRPARPRGRGRGKPPAGRVSRPRALTSAERPLWRSDQARPPPRSSPKPVSASPPSWRAPISRLGVSAPPPSVSPRHVPSSPSRSRVTAASAAARLPLPSAPPRTAAEVVRTPIASVFTASSTPPSAGAFTSTPRSPAAAIIRSMSVSIGFAFSPSGIRVSVPAP